jgi:TorA maturation chaperone TorD
MIADTFNGMAGEETIDEIAMPEVAQLRQFAYRLFAALLLFPTKERLRAVAAAANEAHTESAFIALFPFSNSWLGLLDTLTALPESAMQAIEAEHCALFRALTSEPVCPPHESFYLPRSNQDTGPLEARLIQRYREAGLALEPTMEQSPDHVTVELEFMAYLCGHEQLAWQGIVSEGGVRALKRQRAFLRRHLAWWFPAFAHRIVSSDERGFYAGVAEVAGAFLHHEVDLIDLLIDVGEQSPADGGGQHVS